jgi:hypothetical protein
VPHVFVLLHVAINAVGGVLAWRLLRAQHGAAVHVDNGRADPMRSAHV